MVVWVAIVIYDLIGVVLGHGVHGIALGNGGFRIAAAVCEVVVCLGTTVFVAVLLAICN